MSGPATRTAARPGAAAPSVQGAPRRAELVLVVGVWLCLAVPQLVQALLVGRGFVPVTGGPRSLPRAVEAVTTAGNTALVLGCAGLLLGRARSLPWRAWPAPVALLAPWLASVALLLADGTRPGATVLLYPAIVVAAWAVRPGPAAVRALGGVVAATAALSVLLGLLLPQRALYAGYEGADLDKSVVGVGILAGMLPSGNNLGLCLAVGLPAVLTLRGRVRWAALAVTLPALAWTFSRTAWLAVAVVLVGGVVLRVLRRRWVAPLALGGLLAVVAVAPWTVRTDSDAANRAGFWREALAAWRESPLVGHGPGWFDEVAASGQDLGGHAYHAHHQLVQTLVTGGIVLTALTLTVLVLAIVRASRLASAGQRWAALTVAALLVVSLLEVPYGSVDRTAFYPYVLVALCLVLLVDPGRGAGLAQEARRPAGRGEGAAGA